VWTSTDDAVVAVPFSMQTTEVCSNSPVFHSNVIGSNFLLISTWVFTASRTSPGERRNHTNKSEEWIHLYYIQNFSFYLAVNGTEVGYSTLRLTAGCTIRG